MAFNLSNLLSTLDSSIAALDSASDLLEVLQAINATNPNSGNGKSQRKYYTSVASLPAADSAMRGMVAVVSTAVEDSDNGLYLCTGTAWTEIQSQTLLRLIQVFKVVILGMRAEEKILR